MSSNVKEISDQTFKAEVLDESIPVLVDFWAPWCGPCRMVAPVVDELAGEMAGKVKFTKLNVDNNQASAAQYGIMSIPALLIFKNGQVVQQHVGAVPKATLKVIIDKTL
jgi:thioredoxin 1